MIAKLDNSAENGFVSVRCCSVAISTSTGTGRFYSQNLPTHYQLLWNYASQLVGCLISLCTVIARPVLSLATGYHGLSGLVTVMGKTRPVPTQKCKSRPGRRTPIGHMHGRGCCARYDSGNGRPGYRPTVPSWRPAGPAYHTRS